MLSKAQQRIQQVSEKYAFLPDPWRTEARVGNVDNRVKGGATFVRLDGMGFCSQDVICRKWPASVRKAIW